MGKPWYWSWEREEASLAGGSRQQCGRGSIMEAGADGFQDELEGGSALKPTGGQHGPEALAGGAAAGAARALRDDPIDDHKAQGLFGVVVHHPSRAHPMRPVS